MRKQVTAETVAWVLVLAAVFCVTILKAHVDGGPFWSAAVQTRRELRLIPLEEFHRPSVWYGPWLNLVGNVALFAPVGFLARRRAVSAGFALSALVEVTQFVTASGYSDVDDIMFNTLGAALGGWAATRYIGRGHRRVARVLALGALAVVAAFAGAGLHQLG